MRRNSIAWIITILLGTNLSLSSVQAQQTDDAVKTPLTKTVVTGPDKEGYYWWRMYPKDRYADNHLDGPLYWGGFILVESKYPTIIIGDLDSDVDSYAYQYEKRGYSLYKVFRYEEGFEKGKDQKVSQISSPSEKEAVELIFLHEKKSYRYKDEATSQPTFFYEMNAARVGLRTGQYQKGRSRRGSFPVNASILEWIQLPGNIGFRLHHDKQGNYTRVEIIHDWARYQKENVAEEEEEDK